LVVPKGKEVKNYGRARRFERRRKRRRHIKRDCRRDSERVINAGQTDYAGANSTACERRSPAIARAQARLQTSLDAKVGKTAANNALTLGESLGLNGMRHVGDFRFEGWGDGHFVSVQTEPVKSSETAYGYNRIRITGVRID
jgi:hypothetical protein